MAAISSRGKCALRMKLDACIFNRNILHKRLSNLPRLLNNYDFQPHYDGCFATKRHLSLPTRNVVGFHSSPTKLQKVVSFNLSDIGEGIREVIVKEWFVNVGDTVAQFDKICEVQSDKASVTITSRYDGVVTRLYHEVDGVALVGEPLMDIQTAGGAAEALPPPVQSDASRVSVEVGVEAEAECASGINKSLATPAVRRLAAENKVQLSSVPASGKKGRVLKEDILEYLKNATVPTSAKPLPERSVKDRTQPVSGYAKAMVKTMTEAQKIPHLTYCDEINVSELVLLCSRLRGRKNDAGVKITYLPFFIKATSMALQQYPVVNSSVDANCEHITYKAAHNIGVAMATPSGLIVPNIKHVQDRSVLQIAVELQRLQQLGMQSAIGLQDLTGGSITLSNIGAIGGTYCVPVILPPEVAIAALGRVQVLPRYDAAGSVVRTHVLHLSWSADHRVIDGATIANFSNVVKECIENPEVLLLGT